MENFGQRQYVKVEKKRFNLQCYLNNELLLFTLSVRLSLFLKNFVFNMILAKQINKTAVEEHMKVHIINMNMTTYLQDGNRLSNNIILGLYKGKKPK